MPTRRKKRKFEEDVIELDWEKKYIFSEELRVEMESMWEIPQIFHFLQLAKKALNIPHLSMYEMERMLLMPRASKQLANIMTCLLSSPNLKSKLHKIPPMPYEFWTNVLMHKVRSWFKIYQNKHKNNIKVLESIGVESEFWNIFPDISCLEGKDFDKLTFKQRVWLLKTVCDTILHNRKTVQEELLKQSWENKIETILGIDRHGARYIYFPQFLQNDLRVYRHCLDNRILSTVKPPIIKEEPNWEVKDEATFKYSSSKLGRSKRRKSRWRNGSLPYKGRKRKEREKRRRDEKLRKSPYNADAVNNLMNKESTSLSNVSNFGNNNNINYESITERRSTSIPKVFEESSEETKCSFNKSLEDEGFKGFKEDCEDELNNIPIIWSILNQMISKIEESLEGLEENTLDEIAETQLTDINKFYLSSAETSRNLQSNNSSTESASESESWNDLSISEAALKYEYRNSRKCLTEENTVQTSALDSQEISKIPSNDAARKCLPEASTLQTSAPNSQENSKSTSKDSSKKNAEEETSNESISLKFPNEDLSETKAAEKISETIDEDLKNDEVCLDKWLHALSKRKALELEKEGGCVENDKKGECKLSKLIKKEAGCKDISITKKEDEIKQETSSKDNAAMSSSESDYESSLIELRDTMINEASFDDFQFSDDKSCTLRNIKVMESESWNFNVQDFKELITDLSVSDFKLVADSVEALRNFIDDFSCKEHNRTRNKDVDTFIPICEVNLLSKLSNLLKSVENIETALEDCTRKARSKLQKEWLSFRDGVKGRQGLPCYSAVEDKDLANEDGVTSNWWSIGSLSGSLPEHSDGESGKRSEHHEQDQTEESKEKEQEENEESESDAEPQPKRVLRARGISSYTEQFLSDNSEAEELERCFEFEASFSMPNIRTKSLSPHGHSQLEKSDKRSDTEDSDQDWILPSSRKRRNKRPSANRRLKSFQHKLQNIKANTNVSPAPSEPTSSEALEEKSEPSQTTESESKEEPQQRISESQKAPTSGGADELQKVKKKSPEKKTSSDAICKIECADSVHSELDIKDEGPIVDSAANANNYVNMQQNYVVVKTEPPPTNYYLMHQNPALNGVVQGPFMQQTAFVPSAMPPTQQVHSSPSGYYVQSTSNYMVQGPHSSFGAPRHAVDLQSSQQMVLQQSPQIIGTPQVMTQPNYVQYLVNNPQQNLVNSNFPHPRIITPSSPRASYVNTHAQPRGQLINQQVRMGSRFPQSRMTTPRQNFAHPNGAVIRSMPIGSNGSRFPAVRNMAPRSVAPRQNIRSAAPKVQRLPKPNTTTSNTTSLIVLSDSDDEIEMIITEKTGSEANPTPSASSPRKNSGQPIQRRKPIVTSEVTVSNPKSTLPPQIVQRMSQGGISITPVKATPPPANTNTQLVVVVNETGSHYALALPNGSKLILTPEQVAQIRASNGGKLIL